MNDDLQKPHPWDSLKNFQRDVEVTQPVGKPHFSVVVIACPTLGRDFGNLVTFRNLLRLVSCLLPKPYKICLFPKF